MLIQEVSARAVQRYNRLSERREEDNQWQKVEDEKKDATQSGRHWPNRGHEALAGQFLTTTCLSANNEQITSHQMYGCIQTLSWRFPPSDRLPLRHTCERWGLGTEPSDPWTRGTSCPMICCKSKTVTQTCERWSRRLFRRWWLYSRSMPCGNANLSKHSEYSHYMQSNLNCFSSATSNITYPSAARKKWWE